MDYRLGNNKKIKSLGETVELTCPQCENKVNMSVFSNSELTITAELPYVSTGNVYFLVCRTDNDLQSGDTATVHIANGQSGYYSVTLALDGTYSVTENGSSTVLASGETVVKTVTDGAVIECAIPKSTVELADAVAFRVAPALANKVG